MIVINEGAKDIFENEVKESNVEMCETDGVSCGIGN